MSRAARHWRALRGLSWPERRLLAQAMILLPVAAASVSLLGLRRTNALLLRKADATAARRDLPAARAIARLVHGAAPWSPLRAACLPRAIVLCRLLTRQGLEADLRLGATTSGGAFSAHAWVEHAGVPLSEPESESCRFAVFATPSPRSGG